MIKKRIQLMITWRELGKSIFPTNEALLKMLYLATQDVMRKWTGRIHNWGQILLQLSIFFPDKVKLHLR